MDHECSKIAIARISCDELNQNIENKPLQLPSSILKPVLHLTQPDGPGAMQLSHEESQAKTFT